MAICPLPRTYSQFDAEIAADESFAWLATGDRSHIQVDSAVCFE